MASEGPYMASGVGLQEATYWAGIWNNLNATKNVGIQAFYTNIGQDTTTAGYANQTVVSSAGKALGAGHTGIGDVNEGVRTRSC